MLGKQIVNAALLNAKRHIKSNTNPEGFINIERVNEINNRSARLRALLELGYVAEQGSASKIRGYRKP